MVTADNQEKYNGWTNRETWNVQLWITNTESLYKLIKGLLGTRQQGSVTTGEFADRIEGFLWIIWDGITPDNLKLNPVNWVEIAEHWFHDYDDYLTELDQSAERWNGRN